MVAGAAGYSSAMVRMLGLVLVVSASGRAVHANGATRQLAAFERTGEVHGVVDDLIERTEASWERHDGHRAKA